MNSTLAFFDDHASLYDVYQETCVPKYREALQAATGWLGQFIEQRGRPVLLDLGCGTGNTTLELLKVFPQGEISCVDGSAQMIAQARQKLRHGNVTFHHRDLAQGAWNAPWTDNPIDGAISVFVLEHLPFDAYRQVLADVSTIMKPGAWLVTAEGYAGERCHKAFFKEMGRLEENAVSHRAITRDQLDRVKQLSAEHEVHYFATVDKKKQWWLDAGFTDVDVIWLYYCIGVMVGRKPL